MTYGYAVGARRARSAAERCGWRAPCLALALVVLGVGGCASPIVGAECRDGLVACDGECVDLDSDPRHCGACGRACEDGQDCRLGVCVGEWDGAVGDAAVGEGGVDPYADGGVTWPPDDGGAVDASTPGPDGGSSAGSDGGSGASDGGASAMDAGASDAGGGSTDPDGGVMGIDGGAVGGDGGTFGADGGEIGPDGGPPAGCGLGELDCAGVCVRPDSDPMHCGGCGMACGAGEYCASGTCAAVCGAPLLVCDGECVDPSRHPDHCGGCGNPCPSGVCVAGVCASPRAGHLVLVGHDYRSSRVHMNRVAGNAVFLGRGNPVRALVYEGDAHPDAVVGVDAAVAQVATETGRLWTRTVASTPADVPLHLTDADVFVVYAQTGATDATLESLGRTWGTALGTFLRNGGVVVLFDGTFANEGAPHLLEHAGLMTVTGRADASGRILDVVAPADAVAWGVPLRYRGESSTVRYTSASGITVVADGAAPVVVHATVLP